jgi:N-acetyl-D-muramate 6-phosphate phosphatase
VERVAAAAVIFDLDGTVWDSHPFYAAAIAGGDLAAQGSVRAQLSSGKPAAKLLRQSGVSDRRFVGLCTADDGLALYPGVSATIKKLRARQTPLGAVTNLPDWMVTPMLARHDLDAVLDSVVTFGRTTRRKPHPDPLLLCCRELGVDADESCWYVGDSPGDCAAAKAAGASFAWAAWGYGSDAPAGSDATVRRSSDVVKL